MDLEVIAIIWNWLRVSRRLQAAVTDPDRNPTGKVRLYPEMAPPDCEVPYLVYRVSEEASPDEDFWNFKGTFRLDVWDSHDIDTRCKNIAQVAKKRLSRLQNFCTSAGLPLNFWIKFQAGNSVATGTEKVFRYEMRFAMGWDEAPESPEEDENPSQIPWIPEG